MAYRIWSAEERFRLRSMYGRAPTRRIARELGRTQAAVRQQARHMGLVQGEWTHAELELLRREYRRFTVAQLAAVLDRSPEAVRGQAHRLGISRRKRGWTADEVAYLEANYPAMTTQELADALGVKSIRVRDKLQQLGLRKRSMVLSPEAEAVLWELRDEPGIEEYFARATRTGLQAVRRAMARLRESGGPSRPLGPLESQQIGRSG